MQSAQKSGERREHQDQESPIFGNRAEEQESAQRTKNKPVRQEKIQKKKKKKKLEIKRRKCLKKQEIVNLVNVSEDTS